MAVSDAPYARSRPIARTIGRAHRPPSRSASSTRPANNRALERFVIPRACPSGRPRNSAMARAFAKVGDPFGQPDRTPSGPNPGRPGRRPARPRRRMPERRRRPRRRVPGTRRPGPGEVGGRRTDRARGHVSPTADRRARAGKPLRARPLRLRDHRTPRDTSAVARGCPPHGADRVPVPGRQELVAQDRRPPPGPLPALPRRPRAADSATRSRSGGPAGMGIVSESRNVSSKYRRASANA